MFLAGGAVKRCKREVGVFIKKEVFIYRKLRQNDIRRIEEEYQICIRIGTEGQRSAGGKMKIENIRVNGVNEPIGFQMQQPVISWNISGKISGNPGTGITVTAENGSTVSVSENADPLGTLIPMQLSANLPQGKNYGGR